MFSVSQSNGHNFLNNVVQRVFTQSNGTKLLIVIAIIVGICEVIFGATKLGSPIEDTPRFFQGGVLVLVGLSMLLSAGVFVRIFKKAYDQHYPMGNYMDFLTQNWTVCSKRELDSI